ncbi:DUF2804 domain-containing protein [Spongiibacter pelagi]|uniref:DUF2804 domain-containing protein n=1 Tax=Spongiibacter pelagi TaxID=2760804 RepID=UPI00295AA6BB|nr:DUF2804 domain-containing protein [Spongiibacter pelagi]
MTKKLIINQQADYGYHPGGVDDVNFMDFNLRTAMDKPISARRKKQRFNRFEFVSVASPSLILGAAIVDLGWVSNAFVYLFEPASGRFEEFSFLQPLGRKTEIEPRPKNGVARFQKGANRIEISADAEQACRFVSLNLKGVSAELRIDESQNYQPLGVCCRAGYNGWVYTQKAAGLPVTGQITWQGQEFDVAQQQALASVDWSGGFMRRETAWNWASLSAVLPDGRRLGMNLAAGVNETGFTENGLWLGGELIQVAPADFRFERYSDSAAWQITTADGVVDLRFEPAGKRCEKVNAGFIASNFTQHFGKYYGELNLPQGRLVVDGLWGLTEDHYARW